MDQIHGEYMKKLWRCATLKEINKFKISENHLKLENTLEFKILQINKNYFGIDNLISEKDLLFINTINTNFVTKLYYLPRQTEFEYLYLRVATLDKSVINTVVNNYIYCKNDYKYLTECNRSFSKLSLYIEPPLPIPNNLTNLKYYGPVGLSGYAKMTRNIVESLIGQFNIEFVPMQFHNYSFDNQSKFDYTLSRLTKNKCENYEFVVIHSMPDLWPAICKSERLLNSNVKIYGISVWEIETLPLKWKIYSQFVDKISTPSQFSSISFQKSFPQVETIHHPLKVLKSHNTSICLIKQLDLKEKFDYIFYNISEFSNRKGVLDLIKAFSKVDNERTALYVKTFGLMSENELRAYVAKHFPQKFSKIFFDFARVDDDYINCIHNCADCYVSLSKSEGHGIGVCEAMLACNHVITTGYGAQLEYLKDPTTIDYEMVPATLCSSWSTICKKCEILPHCQHFDGFLPCLHLWAQPKIDSAVSQMELAAKEKLRGEEYQKNFILENFNQSVFAERLTKSILETKLIDPKFRKKSVKKYIDELENISLIQSQAQIFKTLRPKLTIKVLAASMYGNVGDHAIANTIYKSFAEDYEIIQVPDVYVHTDSGLVLFKDALEYGNIKLSEFGALLIGGGGIFRANFLKNKTTPSSLLYYVNYCLKHSIPYYIVGVGFQDLEVHSSSVDSEFKKNFGDYDEILNGADYVSMRSAPDYHFAASLMKNNLTLHFHPDLAYGFSTFYPIIDSERKYLLVLPTKTWIKLEQHHVQSYIKREMELDNGLELIFLEMGGEDAIDKDLLSLHYPNATYISGIRNQMDEEEEEEEEERERTLTLQKFWDILCKTKIILTGRYHGLVLGKVAKVPIIETFNYCNYKFAAERRSNFDSSIVEYLSKSALKPLIEIKNMIDHGKVTYKLWNENDRNSSIVQINERSGIDINILQNFNNFLLEKTLREW